MSKTEIPIPVKIINFDTSVPFKEVISRLDAQVNKGQTDNFMTQLRLANNQAEFEDVVNKATQGNDFLYFTEVVHHNLLRFTGGQDKQNIVVYTIGNPLIAQNIIKHNPFAAYNIPPRLLILEKRNGTGTTVSYHLPSSTMSMPLGGNDEDLQGHLDILDKKMEKLVMHITAEKALY